MLRVPRQHAAFANSEVNNQIILVQAALRHLVELYNQGKTTMTEYSEAFGREVLAVVASKHPARVQMIDIKEALTPEPTDQELLTALDALSIDGYIDGKEQLIGAGSDARPASPIASPSTAHRKVTIRLSVYAVLREQFSPKPMPSTLDCLCSRRRHKPNALPCVSTSQPVHLAGTPRPSRSRASACRRVTMAGQPPQIWRSA